MYHFSAKIARQTPVLLWGSRTDSELRLCKSQTIPGQELRFYDERVSPVLEPGPGLLFGATSYPPGRVRSGGRRRKPDDARVHRVPAAQGESANFLPRISSILRL